MGFILILVFEAWKYQIIKHGGKPETWAIVSDVFSLFVSLCLFNLFISPLNVYSFSLSLPLIFNLLRKSHNALVPYPTIYHFVTEMGMCVHISVAK